MTAASSNLAMQIGELCRLEGEFQLRSGTTATTYFDKYLFESDPAVLRAVADELARLVPDDVEVLAGLELGGVPVVTALSLATGLPAAFVRKVAKPYGTAKLAEGAAIEGRTVLVVEDVIPPAARSPNPPATCVTEAPTSTQSSASSIDPAAITGCSTTLASS
ncbi:MAG: orotate phosphoribosyltransferase [Microthrixaceae bacterium]